MLTAAHTFHTALSSEQVAGMREPFIVFKFHVIERKCVKVNETALGPGSFSVHYSSCTFGLAECGAHGSCRWVEHTSDVAHDRFFLLSGFALMLLTRLLEGFSRSVLVFFLTGCLLCLCRLCVIAAGLNFELPLSTD